MMSNLHQVGGTHYERLKIQPVKLFVQYNLNWFQGEAIKYPSRFPHKGGLNDLQKSVHIMDMALEYFGPTLFDEQDFQLYEPGSEPMIELYAEQFKEGFFKEPISFRYFHSFLYSVISRKYKKAKEELQLIIYAEYEV